MGPDRGHGSGLRKRLKGGTTPEDRFWFIKVVSDVPDISLTVGNVATWCVESMPKGKDVDSLALFQFMMSAVSFQVQNPAKAKEEEAVDLAGMEGVLRAYENLVAKEPKTRTAKMDEALALRAKGGLPAFVKKLRAEKPAAK